MKKTKKAQASSESKKELTAKKPSEKRGSSNLQSVKGMHDILASETIIYEKAYRTFRDLCEYYSFNPITTPILEPIELYQRTTGETSDIVEKEMFSLRTKGKDMLALRPEFTPGICRAYLEHGMNKWPQPVKLFSIGPLFRYQKPQAGRLRQFNQMDIEIISLENDPIYDVQSILIAFKTIEALRVKNLNIKINSIGCKNCRSQYRKHLTNYYGSHEKSLCLDCKRRAKQNVLRLLDCKVEKCQPIKQGAPVILDHFCNDCKGHFRSVLEHLDNLKLPYVLDHFLVRGLDYYTNTVFEIFSDSGNGEINFALAGGGRYDYLIESLGGKHTPAVGAAIGVESTIEAMRYYDVLPKQRASDKNVFFVHVGELAKKQSLSIIEELRKEKIAIVESLGKESLGAQLKQADKLQAPLALIFGQKEAYEEAIILRDMKSGAQETVPLSKIAGMIKRRLV